VVLHTVAADRYLFSGQIVHNPAAAAAGFIPIGYVEPGHALQRRLTQRRRPVVELGTGQPQQRTLAPDPELNESNEPTGVVHGRQSSCNFFLSATPAPSAAFASVARAQPLWPGFPGYLCTV